MVRNIAETRAVLFKRLFYLLEGVFALPNDDPFVEDVTRLVTLILGSYARQETHLARTGDGHHLRTRPLGPFAVIVSLLFKSLCLPRRNPKLEKRDCSKSENSP